MPWLETDVREQRMQFIVEALQPKVNISALCHHRGISRKTGLQVAGAVSRGGLADRRGRALAAAPVLPRADAPAVTARVVALRRQYGWAGRKLRPLLAAEGLRLAPATIDRIIRRAGLVDPDEAHRPARQRFERAHPNELWQMDFKGQYPLRRPAECFPLSVLDDHSRYAVGLWALGGTAGGPRCTPAGALLRGIRAAGRDADRPRGAVVVCAHGHGLTRLAVALLTQGIELIHSGVRHPQTQGKVERFHRTLGRRLRQWDVPTTLDGFTQALARFRVEYNDVRPHEALGLEPPSAHYQPSGRRYQPRPPAWDYPAGHLVLRVDHTGSIRYRGRRYFVCQALEDEGLAVKGSITRCSSPFGGCMCERSTCGPGRPGRCSGAPTDANPPVEGTPRTRLQAPWKTPQQVFHSCQMPHDVLPMS